MVSVPVRRPLAVGVKYTYTVQLEPLGKLPPQLSTSLKSPVTVMLEIAAGPTPLSVTACGVAVVPTGEMPKARLPVERPTAANALISRTRKLYWSETNRFPVPMELAA